MHTDIVEIWSDKHLNSSIPMDLLRGFSLICITMILLSLNSSNVEGRYHYHKNPKNKGSKTGPPVSTPSPQSPVSQPPPSNPPSVPSDPSPDRPGNSTSDCIFDVTDFGAIGDGSTDDTNAFEEAWKAACKVESATVLAPSNYNFMITSTIFSGPCKPGLVFQVRIWIN